MIFTITSAAYWQYEKNSENDSLRNESAELNIQNLQVALSMNAKSEYVTNGDFEYESYPECDHIYIKEID